MLAELIYQRTKDPHYAIMAKDGRRRRPCCSGRHTDRNHCRHAASPALAGIHGSDRKVMSLPFQIEIYAFLLRLYLCPFMFTQPIG
ncbi:hypothetical protein PO124_18125 [Bacillus licheniformis]|nr:hypothetical protein [Bacillus licheniformis]